MHFAVGMVGGGGLALLGCAVLRRGWRYTPLAMTLGGIWAVVPDLPRLFTEDFPSLPFAAILGGKPLEHWLDTQGNWFFMHRMLDEQPKEFALHGLLGILLLYNLAIVGQLISSRRGRKLPAAAEPELVPQTEPGDAKPDIVGTIGPTSRTG